MNIFIDCEWNDFKGDLISMALVPEYGDEFYEVLTCNSPSEWVAKNVMTVLEKQPVASMYIFQKLLAEYLESFDKINIIADWPEDIERFCAALIISAGQRIGSGHIKFEFDHNLESVESKVPHNALWDARAIRDSFAL